MVEEQKVGIPRVKLGNQGLEVSKLGFGCMGLTGSYNDPLSDELGISILKHAFSKGITFFDTADCYGANANEVLVGKALKQLPRESIQLATKFGIVRFEANTVVVNGTPEYVRACCEASLKRLDVEYIDLYYMHRVDTSVPIEDSMEELKKLVEEGKIKYIGLSEASPDTIRRAHAVHPITALQMEWSLWTRDIEEEIVPLCSGSEYITKISIPYVPGTVVPCDFQVHNDLDLDGKGTFQLEIVLDNHNQELGIGLVPYSPLARGFFAGRAVVDSLPANSALVSHPRFKGENLEKNKILYTRIEKLAKKYGCTPAQLALAWVLHQGDDVIPIPGTTKIKNLDDNIDSVRLELTQEDLKEISDAVPLNEVAGLRSYESMSNCTWNVTNTPPKGFKIST